MSAPPRGRMAGSEKPGSGEPSEAGPIYTVLPSEQGKTLGEEKAEEQS